MHMALTDKDKITREQFDQCPDSYFSLLQEIETMPICTPNNHIFKMSEHKILWAVNNNNFIGGFSIRYAEDQKSKNFLNGYVGHCGLSVRPSQRNKGYGQAIWRYAKEDAKKKGMPYIVGGAHPSNISSWRSIENAGGEFLYTKPDTYGWGEGKMYKLCTD